jgi:uncharacterized protein YbcC (UPF0753/DUF2309 family)
VLVEAQPYEIDKAIDQSQMVTQLADNGWVRIFSLDRESQRLSLRGRGGIWHAFKLKPMTSEDHNTFNEVEIQ